MPLHLGRHTPPHRPTNSTFSAAYRHIHINSHNRPDTVLTLRQPPSSSTTPARRQKTGTRPDISALYLLQPYDTKAIIDITRIITQQHSALYYTTPKQRQATQLNKTQHITPCKDIVGNALFTNANNQQAEIHTLTNVQLRKTV